MIKLIELDGKLKNLSRLISKSNISSRIKSFIDLFKGKGYVASDFKRLNLM